MKKRIAMLATTALMTLITYSGDVMAEVFQFTFGSGGSGPGQFQAARGVAVDAAGNIYVADQGNDRIQKFDPAGTFLLAFGVPGPVAVAVDGNGDVYAADPEDRQVRKFDAFGNFLGRIDPICTIGIGNCTDPDGAGPRPPVYQPVGVAVDAADNVYVIGTFHLQKFAPAGNLLVEFPLGGIVPTAIAVDDIGNIVIYEKDNGTVDKLDASGNRLLRFGKAGCNIATGFGCTDPDGAGPLELGDGQFGIGGATAVATDRLGNIYVADGRNFRIQKFAANGNFLLKFGSRGAAPGQFDGPMGLAVDTMSRLYVADTDNDRVQVFATDTLAVDSATGAGPVTFVTSSGEFRDVIAVAEGSLPTAGKPGGVTFPFGFFNWRVIGLIPGQTITVTITYPSNVAPPAQYWKVINGIWTDVTSLVGSDDGDNVLTLTITDGGLGDADGQVNGQISDPGGLAVVAGPANRPPVAHAGLDRTEECHGHDGATIMLDGTASTDPDGNLLTFTWTGPFGKTLGPTPIVTLPRGTHNITLTVEDPRGASSSDSVVIIVADTTPPTLARALSPDVLWPPSHRLVHVDAQLEMSDVCDPNPRVMLVSILSSEPDNGLGDGDTVNDIQDAQLGTDDRSFLLRAERSGKGRGRTYTVFYRATDTAGNATTASATVIVPHSRP